MSSRSQILQAVRARTLEPVELPGLKRNWIQYEDRARQFADALKSVGGICVFLDSRKSVLQKLAEHPAFGSAKKIVSLIPDVPGNLDLEKVVDPHEVEDVDFAIMPGQFGVAENGAVWTTDAGVKHRAIYFIVQHLVLVIDADQIVDNMHQAYEKLTLPERGFSAFISGPSKTADIEQSLVIGAHGPRSLTVACIAGG